jgi:hypothetical protein
VHCLVYYIHLKEYLTLKDSMDNMAVSLNDNQHPSSLVLLVRGTFSVTER